MTLKLPKRKEINMGLVKVADRAAFSIPRDRPFSKRGCKTRMMDFWPPKASHNHWHLSCCRLFMETLVANPSTWLVNSRLLQYKTLESHILVRTMFFAKQRENILDVAMALVFGSAIVKHHHQYPDQYLQVSSLLLFLCSLP